jgi:cytochrome c556
MSHLILRSAAPVSMAAVLVLAGTIACNRSNAERGSDAPGMKQRAGAAAPLPERGLTTRPMADHWMQTPELKALMARLAQSADAARQPLPGDPEKPPTPEELDKAFANAATLAEQLSAASRDIPAAAAWLKLDEGDRRGFVAEAQSLGKYAAQLKQDASARQAEAMDRTLTQINATCVTCHTRYRDRSAAPDPFQADAGGAPVVAMMASAPTQ